MVQSDQPHGDAAGWYPDPAGDYDLRYHNGMRWTGDVSTDGERFVAPLVPTPNSTSQRTGTLALTAGVISLSIAWIPFVCVIGAAFGVVAITSGLRGRSAPTSRAGATVGLVTGSIALLFAAVGVWLSVVVLEAIDEYQNPGEFVTEITECVQFDGGSRASGSITNLSSGERDYVIEVEFDDGRVIDTAVDDVAPADTAMFTVEEDFRFDNLECRVSSVTGPKPFGLDIDG